jgi:hypothetical protein
MKHNYKPGTEVIVRSIDQISKGKFFIARIASISACNYYNAYFVKGFDDYSNKSLKPGMYLTIGSYRIIGLYNETYKTD